MATRVYELAKELGVGNKEMLNKLNGMGIEVSSHMNVVSEKDCLAVRNAMAKGGKSKEGKNQKSAVREEKPKEAKPAAERKDRNEHQSKNRPKQQKPGQEGRGQGERKRARIRFPELLRKRRRNVPTAASVRGTVLRNRPLSLRRHVRMTAESRDSLRERRTAEMTGGVRIPAPAAAKVQSRADAIREAAETVTSEIMRPARHAEETTGKTAATAAETADAEIRAWRNRSTSTERITERNSVRKTPEERKKRQRQSLQEQLL